MRPAVYAHCLFCNADLGRNEALEAFPVGRRLAFDAAKGRLWVVCSRCARWNLTPLEERWEAIEQAERLYRGTRLRASTDNVGLARVRSGMDLVRIGKPLGPELAAWRYGSVLARRRRRAIAEGVAKVVAFAAVEAVLFGPVAAIGRALGSVNQLDPEYAPDQDDLGSATVRVPVRISGVPLRVDVRIAAVRVRLASDGTPSVFVPFGREIREFTAGDALTALGPVLARLNGVGAPAVQVDRAVRRLARAGGASAYLADLGARRSRMQPARAVPPRRAHDDGATSVSAADSGTFTLHALAPLDRLACEMAFHDERERRALDGELAELERAWRDAEEIAAIADDLVLPRGVQDAWKRLRDRVRS